MENNNAEKSNLKKRILHITTVLLIVLILCTVLSRSIYNLLLPCVQTAKVSRGEINFWSDCEGEITYLNRQDMFVEGASWKFTAVHVVEGASVSAGDVVAEIDMRQANILIAQSEWSILLLKQQLASTSTWDERQSINKQLEIEEMNLELLHDQYPADGKIIAPFDGVVAKVLVAPGQIAVEGETAMVMVPNDSQPFVVWTMDGESARQYETECPVMVTLSTYHAEGDNKTKNTIIDTKVLSKTYVSSEDSYRFTAAVDSLDNPELGKPAQIRISRPSKQYSTVLPKSCVQRIDGTDYVYTVKERDGLFGPENYVNMVSVEVIESNNLYAAVEGTALSEGTLVVRETNKALLGDETVKVE